MLEVINSRTNWASLLYIDTVAAEEKNHISQLNTLLNKYLADTKSLHSLNKKLKNEVLHANYLKAQTEARDAKRVHTENWKKISSQVSNSPNIPQSRSSPNPNKPKTVMETTRSDLEKSFSPKNLLLDNTNSRDIFKNTPKLKSFIIVRSLPNPAQEIPKKPQPAKVPESKKEPLVLDMLIDPFKSDSVVVVDSPDAIFSQSSSFYGRTYLPKNKRQPVPMNSSLSFP